MNGVPKEIVISERQIAESLAEPVSAIVEAVKALATLGEISDALRHEWGTYDA